MLQITAAVVLCCLAAASLLVVLAWGIVGSTVPGNLGRPGAAVVFYTEEEPALRRRVKEGVRLLANGDVTLLVMVGGWRPGRHFHGASRMRHAAVALGVPADAVLIDDGSNDSFSNLEQAHAALALAEATPHVLVLVSDRLHLMRLSLIARQQGIEPFPLLSPTSDPVLDLHRVKHELVAYAVLLLPRDVVRAVLKRLRHE